MRKLFFLKIQSLLLAVLPLGLAGYSWAEPAIRIDGSTTVVPVVSRAAEIFMRRHPGLTITVNSGGSGVGINAVAEGRVNIGMISRRISADERARFIRVDFREYVVGRDAVACVVSSEVYAAGVKSLAREQIRDIYLGKIVNWRDVGGPDRRIVVVDKETHRGTRHVFMEYVFGDARARAPGARLVTGSNNEERAKIAQSDAAIGMLSFAWIDREAVGIGMSIEGGIVEPTLENIRAGKFPVSRDLSLVVAGEPKGAVREFIDFILSPEGQKIVEASGYVPVW